MERTRGRSYLPLNDSSGHFANESFRLISTDDSEFEFFAVLQKNQSLPFCFWHRGTRRDPTVIQVHAYVTLKTPTSSD
jgi:hypothetical protein